MNNLDTYAALIGKHLTGEASPEEEQRLFSWVEASGDNRKFFEEIGQVWKLAENSKLTDFNPDFGKAWGNIEDALDKNAGTLVDKPKPSNRIVTLSKTTWRWSIAAAILALVAAGLWWLVNQPAPSVLVEVHTGPNERKEIALPDGSHIWLNENTSIAYMEAFVQRDISLEGEAFFEVERMEKSPFVIKSGDAKTTVLGTAFNVRAYPAEAFVEVTVETGKVALSGPKQDDKPLVLPAGTSGIFDIKEGTTMVEADKIVNANAWKTKKLVFENALVKDVLQSFERYFDLEIIVSNELILECHYSSVLEEPNAEEALNAMAFALNLKLEKKDSAFVLNGSGCSPDN